MADEQIKLDLDARQYLEVRIGAKDYRVYAPPLSRTPELASIAKRIEVGSEAIEKLDPAAAEDLVKAIADYVALHTTEIMREEVMALDLARAIKFLKATQSLLPKGAASPAPGVS